MRPEPCELERFFEPWEFTIGHLLCASDVEPLRLKDLLALADDSGFRMWEELSLGYTETGGHPELRREIARQYDTIEPHQVIVCGGGAAEALFLVANSLLDREAHCVTVWPAYEALYKIPRAAGARVSLVGLDPATGWKLDPRLVEEAFQRDTRGLFVNFPHNPTGTTISRDTLEQLSLLTSEHSATLVSDEVYRDLEFNPSDRLPAAADLSPLAVSVGVMSKAFGLAGLRIGWIATRDSALLSRIQQLKDYTSVCASAPSEILALIALRAKSVILEETRQLLSKNLAELDAFMSAWRDVIDWNRPLGGPICFPRMIPSVDVERLVSELATKESVLLLPGRIFDWDPRFFRIGFGRSDFADALDGLGRHLRRLPA